jgi:hypothetical protein
MIKKYNLFKSYFYYHAFPIKATIKEKSAWQELQEALNKTSLYQLPGMSRWSYVSPIDSDG